DVLRTRERRTGVVADLHELEDEAQLAAELQSRGAATGLGVRLSAWLQPGQLARLRALRRRYTRQRANLARQATPATDWIKRSWPDIKYYLGLLTTVLVVVAWITNLVAKQLATAFGGGVTVLGLAIAVTHYWYQQRRGE